MRLDTLPPIAHVRKKTAGQAVVMLTIGLVFLMSVMGLVVDVGYGYYLKQVAQAVADSAATAAAVAADSSGGACSSTVLCQTNYTCPANPANTTNFGDGCLYAKQNGLSGQTVTLSSGTGAVGGVSTTYWVKATVTLQLPLLFANFITSSPASASAQATGAVLAGTGAGGCIYVLNPSASGAMNVSGSANVYSNCGIYVNSSSSNALIASGGSKTTGSVVDIVGQANISGGSTVTPTPTTGVSPISDPLANLPAPTFSGCNKTGENISVMTTTISPGVYCNGITISGGANVTFNSGDYILNGGGLNVSGNSTITGNGVFFYNTSNGYSFGPIQISGDAGITLTAPTSGTYQGILFFQDRNITSSAANTFSGGSTATVSGSFYMPTASVYFSGGSSTAPLTMAFVVKELNVSGNAYLAKDTTGSLTGMRSSVSTALIQ